MPFQMHLKDMKARDFAEIWTRFTDLSLAFIPADLKENWTKIC